MALFDAGYRVRIALTEQSMSRRRFFAMGGVASVGAAAIFGTHPSEAKVFVRLPNGERIPVELGNHSITIKGDVDERTVAMFDAKLAEAMKQQQADIQRNIGHMMAKWNQRSGV